jgi:phospholipase C
VETLDRRRFLASAAGAALGLSGLEALAAASARAARADLPPPAASGIDHVVVVTLENRSFDHLLGWLGGADGRQAGIAYPDSSGTLVPTHALAPDFTGCGFQDPDHSYDGGRVEFDGGLCDGWLRVNDAYSIGYYRRRDLPFLGQAAQDWTACDRYFCAILGPTFPNRIYQHAGVTDRLANTFAVSTLPTIWDRLAAAGLDGRYYFGNVPFLALWGLRYLSIMRPFPSFLADCATGNLPQVAYVDPSFTILGDEPLTNDDHPHDDIRAGEAFLAKVYAAVTSSPAWPRTVLVITFDEWGGFFDHVPPGTAPDVDPAFAQRGFRVPTLLISPFAKRHEVSHEVFDHTSVLRMIEWRWGLQPLSVRDATATNLAVVLQLDRRPKPTAPAYAVPPFVSGGCWWPQPAAAAAASRTPAPADDEWTGLASLARSVGVDVPGAG